MSVQPKSRSTSRSELRNPSAGLRAQRTPSPAPSKISAAAPVLLEKLASARQELTQLQLTTRAMMDELQAAETLAEQREQEKEKLKGEIDDVKRKTDQVYHKKLKLESLLDNLKSENEALDSLLATGNALMLQAKKPELP